MLLELFFVVKMLWVTESGFGHDGDTGNANAHALQSTFAETIELLKTVPQVVAWGNEVEESEDPGAWIDLFPFSSCIMPFIRLSLLYLLERERLFRKYFLQVVSESSPGYSPNSRMFERGLSILQKPIFVHCFSSQRVHTNASCSCRQYTWLWVEVQEIGLRTACDIITYLQMICFFLTWST